MERLFYIDIDDMKSILTVIIFCIFVVALFKVTQPAAVTSDFAEKAPLFFVLAKRDGQYEVLRLSDALASREQYLFHLDEAEIRLDTGGIYLITVLDSIGERQRIRFYYSDTYVSQSIYEVSDNTITPVEYRLLSSIGHGGLYLLIIAVSAFVAPLGSHFLVWLWVRRKH